MIGIRLSKSAERTVAKTDAVIEVKRDWKTEAKEEGLSLSRCLHNLIQKVRALRLQGRSKLGDRRRVEKLEQPVDELLI